MFKSLMAMTDKEQHPAWVGMGHLGIGSFLSQNMPNQIRYVFIFIFFYIVSNEIYYSNNYGLIY